MLTNVFHRVLVCWPNGSRVLTDITATTIGKAFLRSANVFHDPKMLPIVFEDRLAEWFEPVTFPPVDDVMILGSTIVLSYFLDPDKGFLPPSAQDNRIQQTFWTDLKNSDVLASVPVLTVPDARCDDILDDTFSLLDIVRHSVEVGRCLSTLQRNDRRMEEKDVQCMFIPLFYSFARDRNYDFSAEPSAGAGCVDFKLSRGSEAKAILEFKLSDHRGLVRGFTTQIVAYAKAEEATCAFYVVFDVGGAEKQITQLRAFAEHELEKMHLVVIDARTRPFPSRL